MLNRRYRRAHIDLQAVRGTKERTYMDVVRTNGSYDIYRNQRSL